MILSTSGITVIITAFHAVERGSTPRWCTTDFLIVYTLAQNQRGIMNNFGFSNCWQRKILVLKVNPTIIHPCLWIYDLNFLFLPALSHQMTWDFCSRVLPKVYVAMPHACFFESSFIHAIIVCILQLWQKDDVNKYKMLTHLSKFSFSNILNKYSTFYSFVHCNLNKMISSWKETNLQLWGFCKFYFFDC